MVAAGIGVEDDSEDGDVVVMVFEVMVAGMMEFGVMIDDEVVL